MFGELKTKHTNLKTLMCAVVVTALGIGSMANAQTERPKPFSPDELISRMLERRAVEAVIWGLPAVSMKFFFEGMQAEAADYQDIVYFSKPMVSRHGFLTANNNVPYVAVFLNTKAGPMILDVPAASEKTMYFGSALDMWQTPITDVGPAGADKGKGGKFLFLPPGYKGTVPEGYLVFRPPREDRPGI